MINYDSPRSVQVALERSTQKTSSKLVIAKAHPSDSGNYSCVPSNAEPAHIAVHVLNNGGESAAMQHDKRDAEILENSTFSSYPPANRVAKFFPLLVLLLQMKLIYFGTQL